MSIVEEMQRADQEMTALLKENFMHQLLAFRAMGGIAVKLLKEAAVRTGACHDTFDISRAVNELVKEEKVTIQFIGDSPYLWLDLNK